MLYNCVVLQTIVEMPYTKALYTPGLGEQSGVLNDLMIKLYLGYRNIDELLKLF